MDFDTKDAFNVLAFLFSAATYVFYVKAILQGEQTTLSTWISWMCMDTAILTGQIHEHKVSYQLVAYLLGCVVVLAAARRAKAPLGWQHIDTFCVAMVLGAVALWARTGDVDVATIIELAAISTGSVPLTVHFWQTTKPKRILPWVLNLIGAVFAVAAIKHWDIVGAASPFTFLFLSIGFNIVVLRTLRLRPIGSNTPIGKMFNQLRN